MQNKMRLALLLFITTLLITACGKPPTLVKRWHCSTTHPGGFASTDIFEFSSKGGVTLNSDGLVMYGTYTMKEKQLSIQLENVPVPGPIGNNATQKQTLTGTIQKLTAKELELDLSTGANHHMSKCSALE